MSDLMEKARDLGRQLRSTDEFKTLAEAEEYLKKDLEAMKLMQDVHEAQQKIASLQQAGLQASEEQIEELSTRGEEMTSHPAVKSFYQAQQEFNGVLEAVNRAISEGMQGTEAGEEE